jgi:putative spermidine/putrescine transport system permease protein
MSTVASGPAPLTAEKEVLQPGQRLALGLMLLPVGFILLVFFVLPFLFEILFSFQQFDPNSGYLPGLTARNYVKFFTDDYYLTIWWRTLRISLMVTVLCVAMAYPIALVLARARGWLKTLLLLMTISPLFVPGVVRAYGWMVLLGPIGPIIKILMWTGLFAERPRIIYTETAVLIGMVEVALPFAILPLSAVLGRIDQTLIQQAQSLGASPFQTFVRVTLPLSLTGLAAGSILVFINSMGAFVMPSLLGGARIKTLTYEAYAVMSTMSDWGISSTLGVVVLATTLAGIALNLRLLRSRVPRNS